MDTLPLVLLLLGAAVLGVAAFRHAGLPPVLGYLLVGFLFGPHAFGVMGDTGAAGHLAEFGVVFLMFSIGLEFSVAKLFAMKRLVFGFGGAQVVATMALASALGVLAGLSWQAALVLAGALAMSSTALLVKMLAERGETDSRHGRPVIGALLFQDLAVVPLLVLIPALSMAPEEMAATVMAALLKAAAVLAVVLFAGERIMHRWLMFVAKARSGELFVLNVLLMTLGLAWMTERAGLSLALGAFVAGMLIAETQFRHQVEEDIKPFRDVLMGLFFVTIGMQLDMPVVLSNLLAVLAVLIALLLFKGGLIWGLARLFRMPAGDAMRVGLWLCAGGEFGFVLLALARERAVVPDTPLQVVLAALVLSMLLAALIVHYSERWVMRVVSSEWLLKSMELTRVAAQTFANDGHAIICGFGRSGQHLARLLVQEGFRYVALDLDPERVRDAAAAGENVVFGDPGRTETLVAAGLKRAAVMIITYSQRGDAERVLAVARAITPELPVIVRTADDADLEALYAAGAAEVVPEALESSLMLASHALILMGVPPRRVLRRIRDTRQQHYHLLRGLFHGVSEDDTEGDAAQRLHSVVLGRGAYAVGRCLSELRFGDLAVEVSAIRRRGIRALQPTPEARFDEGDVVVLLGTPESLEVGEARLLKG